MAGTTPENNVERQAFYDAIEPESMRASREHRKSPHRYIAVCNA